MSQRNGYEGGGEGQDFPTYGRLFGNTPSHTRLEARASRSTVIAAVSSAVIAAYLAIFSWDQRLVVTGDPTAVDPGSVDVTHDYAMWQELSFLVILMLLAAWGGYIGRPQAAALTASLATSLCVSAQGIIDIARDHRYGGDLVILGPPTIFVILAAILFGTSAVAYALHSKLKAKQQP